MKSFRTVLKIKKAPFSIAHQHNLLSIGSCFTGNIGNQLSLLKFPILLNPFGILYNPISIATCLKRIIRDQLYTKHELHRHNEQWHSFDHHGTFSNVEQASCLKHINATLTQAHQQLQELDYLTLTFGTAYVFYHKSQKKMVANCHKFPNHQFDRYCLSIEQITEALRPIFNQLQEKLPHLKIILTISPVRHIRDGLVENQRSKATLSVAVNTLERQFPKVHYFPAYELMMDDLRDYRFYKSDMIHPNSVAIDYIWEAFQQAYFDAPTQQLIQQIKKIQQAMAHRPINPNSNAHQRFLQNQQQKVAVLAKRFPFLDFETEMQYFKINSISDS